MRNSLGRFIQGHVGIGGVFKPGHAPMYTGGSKKGRKHKQETKEKIRQSLYKENITYGAIHSWVYKKLGKPTKCTHCNKEGLIGYQVHWANKSGLYKRDLTDWLRLCVKCHKKYDSKKSRMDRMVETMGELSTKTT